MCACRRGHYARTTIGGSMSCMKGFSHHSKLFDSASKGFVCLLKKKRGSDGPLALTSSRSFQAEELQFQLTSAPAPAYPRPGSNQLTSPTMSSITQPTGTRTVSTIPAVATTTARLGSSNVAGWSVDVVSLTRLPRSSTLPYSSPAPSSGGVNTVAVGVGAGVGGAIVLAAAVSSGRERVARP